MLAEVFSSQKKTLQAGFHREVSCRLALLKIHQKAERVLVTPIVLIKTTRIFGLLKAERPDPNASMGVVDV